MLRMLDDSDKDENNYIRPENESPDLDFPWPLITASQDFCSFLCTNELKLFKTLLVSFNVQLALLFIIYTLHIVFGSVYVSSCSDTQMLCVVLILQGTSGLIVVLMHTCVIVKKCILAKSNKIVLTENVITWYFLASAHLFTILCIIWFIIDHIWLFADIPNAQQPFQYIIGAWILFDRIWNSPRALQWLTDKIQYRMTQFSVHDYKRIGDENTAESDSVNNADFNQNQNGDVV